MENNQYEHFVLTYIPRRWRDTYNCDLTINTYAIILLYYF